MATKFLVSSPRGSSQVHLFASVSSGLSYQVQISLDYRSLGDEDFGTSGTRGVRDFTVSAQGSDPQLPRRCRRERIRWCVRPKCEEFSIDSQ